MFLVFCGSQSGILRQ